MTIDPLSSAPQSVCSYPRACAAVFPVYSKTTRHLSLASYFRTPARFVRGFGGIGGNLRWQVDFEEYEEVEDIDDASDDSYGDDLDAFL